MAQSHSHLSSSTIQSFQEDLNARIITPTDPDYDQARRVWNGVIDRHPALIAYPTDAAGVAKAVSFAREQGLSLAIRGGSHSMSGYGVSDNGLVIDMSNFKKIDVNPEARTARFGGGVLGRELGAATAPHGLALPLGQVPSTGSTGVVLGGGIGWLTRQYGLSIDSLLSAEIVTADGRILKASATENPDLFWALRGGGGNFGVVTEMEVQLHPVSLIVGGVAIYPIEKTAEVLRAYRDWSASVELIVDTTIMIMTLPPIPVLPPALHGQQAILVGVCYAGPIEQGMQAVQPLRSIGKPLADIISPMPFTVLQGLSAAAGDYGMQHDIRSGFAQELSDGLIDTVAEQVSSLPNEFSQFHILRLGGAMAAVAPDATAFPARDAAFLTNILVSWIKPEEVEAQRAWAKDFAAALTPYNTGGVYVNFLGDEGPDRVRAAYGSNYERLLTLKRKYDPDNLFSLNQNIAI